MAPVTDFHVKEKYNYLEGFGNYHSSEAFPDTIPLANNTPQKPAYGLRTERISGTSFVAPRDRNLQTWMYRRESSLEHGDFVPLGDDLVPPTSLSPNAYMWPTFQGDDQADWIKQKLLARNGDPNKKEGLAIWLFTVAKSMEERTVFSSLDGDVLIIPQAGTLDIQTELGNLLVRQNEIAVIPRGIRYRVALPAGPARGWIFELYQGHFQLPHLGIVGSTGLANPRDFQIPTAYFDGELKNGVAQANTCGDWTIISRLSGRLWSCTQKNTPFDVAAWHGTNYPYKFDLARFNYLTNAVFDERDPSLYVVLTAPAYGKEPGTAVIDFAIIGPRWQVSEDTFWLPYYHRNTASEFYGPIINAQDPKHPLNAASKNNSFFPFGAALNGGNVTHGQREEDFQRSSNEELKPKKLGDDGVSIMLIETELPLMLSDWADKAAMKNAERPARAPIMKE